MIANSAHSLTPGTLINEYGKVISIVVSVTVRHVFNNHVGEKEKLFDVHFLADDGLYVRTLKLNHELDWYGIDVVS